MSAKDLKARVANSDTLARLQNALRAQLMEGMAASLRSGTDEETVANGLGQTRRWLHSKLTGTSSMTLVEAAAIADALGIRIGLESTFASTLTVQPATESAAPVAEAA